MKLVEQHIVKGEEWRPWCVKAKNLYNQALYYWRQSIFKNIEYFTEYELTGLFTEFQEENFRALPSNTSQQIIKNLFKNIKSWQKARKEWQKHPEKFLGIPKLPKYKKELSELHFTTNQVKFKDGFVHFPKMVGISPMKTNIPNIKHCRVIPKSNHFVVEFVYEFKEQELKPENGKTLGIDLGMNNLATCISTTGKGFIVNGRPIKSINQFYNKRVSKLKSNLKEKVYTSKRIERLTHRRNQKIKNYIHHASKFIVKVAEDEAITKIIIGNNKNWKADINLGKKTNQNFVLIPLSHLIEKIEYKAKKVGISTILTEESYTSKCSALDLEPIQKHENYVGRRVKRGLFRVSNGSLINADINGACNIIRKVAEKDFRVDSVWSSAVMPSRVNVFNEAYCKTKKIN